MSASMSTSESTQSRTPLVRDPSGEKTMYVGAAVCAAVSIGSFLLVSHWGILWLSIPAALLAAGSLAAGMSGCYDGQCPACGVKISPVNFKQVKPTACRQCHHYYDGYQGWLSVVDPERVAQEPVFCAPLPERMMFPNRCAVCCQPATRYHEVVGRKLNAAKLLVGTISTTKVTVDGVPYCNLHSDGVQLDGDHIRFQSYPYMRAFCQFNNLTPGRSPSIWDAPLEEQDSTTPPSETIPVAELVEEEELSAANY